MTSLCLNLWPLANALRAAASIAGRQRPIPPPGNLPASTRVARRDLRCRSALFRFMIGALTMTLSGCVPVLLDQTPPRQVAKPSAPMSRPAPLPQAHGNSSCLSDLFMAKADFAILPQFSAAPQCTVADPVRLQVVAGDYGAIQAGNLSAISCQAVLRFAAWARYGADRAARQILGSGITRIETFGAYNCRTVAGTGTLSGHAAANAIDVSGFVLGDGRRISIRTAWEGGTAAKRQFLRAVFASACRRFGIALSPDFDVAHQDHLHLEITARSLCR